MKYIEFGPEKEKVSSVVLGLMRISELSAQQTDALVKTGLDEGINFIDNADIYGKGRSEELLGEVLADDPSLRDKLFIQSKCAIRHDGSTTFYDHSKEYIMQSAEGCLRRMNTDYMDCFLLHRPDALMEPDEIAEAFTKLYNDGKVKSFGVSNYSPMTIEMLQSALPQKICTDQIQLSIAHTLPVDEELQFNTSFEGGFMKSGGIIEYCRMKDIAVQTWSSLQYGFFEGTFLDSDLYPDLNKVLDRIAEKNNVTKAAVAIAWILRIPGKMQAVIGTTDPKHVRETAKCTEFDLSRTEWYEIYMSAGNRML